MTFKQLVKLLFVCALKGCDMRDVKRERCVSPPMKLVHTVVLYPDGRSVSTPEIDIPAIVEYKTTSRCTHCGSVDVSFSRTMPEDWIAHCPKEWLDAEASKETSI